MALFQKSSILLSSSTFFRSFLCSELLSKAAAPKSLNFYTNPISYCAYKASWQELVGVLIFSAIPFTAVKAIANSPLGELLQRRLEEKKKDAMDNSSKFKALAERARKHVGLVDSALALFDVVRPQPELAEAETALKLI